MAHCYLKGHGHCSTERSNEHYISKAVLKRMEKDRAVRVGGLHWQPDRTLQRIGTNSLQSHILCKRHNSGLSPLDTSADRLWAAVDEIDKDPASVPPLTSVPGFHLERWLLKVAAGLTATKRQPVPDQWKAILHGKPWPSGWGLHVPATKGPRIHAAELEILTMPSSDNVQAIECSMAGPRLLLLLGATLTVPDGHFRPRGLIFQTPSGERRIEFIWPFHVDTAITYTKVGTTNATPPDRAYWT